MSTRLLALACIAFALVVAPAAADSIVYTKDGNVWLSSPDGAAQYQVTFNGNFSDASQADDGTIVALHLKQFVHLDRSGRLLGAPVDAMGSPYHDGGGDFVGPYEPRVSPDGRRIAYWFYSRANTTLERMATWSSVDGFTDPSAASEYVKGVGSPEWIANDRLITAKPRFFMNVWTWKLGTGHGYTSDAEQYWFGLQGPPDQWGVRSYYDFGDPALSPDGEKLAFTDGGGLDTNSRIWLASTNGPAWVGEPPYVNDYTGASQVAAPTLRCSKDVGFVENPSWAPDSTRLAYADGDGVHVLYVGASIDCAKLGVALIAPGGRSPSFGKADVNLADAPTPPAGAGGGGATSGSGSPAGTSPVSAVAAPSAVAAKAAATTGKKKSAVKKKTTHKRKHHKHKKHKHPKRKHHRR